METIIIDKYKKLLIAEDKLIYLRDDVISEHLKNQVYLFESIKKTVYIEKKENPFLRFRAFFWVIAGGPPEEINQTQEIKIIFRDNKFRFIEMGRLDSRKIKGVVKKINDTLRKWEKDEM